MKHLPLLLIAHLNVLCKWIRNENYLKLLFRRYANVKYQTDILELFLHFSLIKFINLISINVIHFKNINSHLFLSCFYEHFDVMMTLKNVKFDGYNFINVTKDIKRQMWCEKSLRIFGRCLVCSTNDNQMCKVTKLKSKKNKEEKGQWRALQKTWNIFIVHLYGSTLTINWIKINIWKWTWSH
jgi:hypothetical protein